MKSRQLGAPLFALTFAEHSSLVQAGPTFYRLHALLNFTREDILMMKRAALFSVLALCASAANASQDYQLQPGGWSVVPMDCEGSISDEWYTPHSTIKSNGHAINWTVHYEVDSAPDKTCTLKGRRQWDFDTLPAQGLCHIYFPDKATWEDGQPGSRHYQTPKWHATINKKGKAVMTCHFQPDGVYVDPITGVESDCTVACHQ